MSIKPQTIIEKANKYLDTDDNRIKYNLFLLKFSECEVFCRPVLKEYFESEGIKPEEIGLVPRNLIDAFSENGIYFSDNKLLFRLFGAADSKNASSCRWLRNKALHELMYRAIQEICVRNEELIRDMDLFISEIKSQS